MSRLALIASTVAVLLLAGCDIPGMGDSAEKQAAAREAEGKAVGGACRHAGRAIEDCYLLNKRVDKAAIFAGWRDMNDYMRENKIDSVTPQLLTQLASLKAAEAKAADAKPADAKASEADDGAAEKRVPPKAKAKDAKPHA
ncbi:MAG TPA: hypothetical protein VJ608_08630 [Albitalea sp.]|nr:hypothetical protein [Albitalea sp.]